jgi:hypothetical protein
MDENSNQQPEPDEVVAVSGDKQLRYTRTDEEGMPWGYVYDPERDFKHPEMYLDAILKFGYWEAPESQ